jgi:hypothetical protein
MPKLLDEIVKLETAIKQRNPNARLSWQDDYHMALETAKTPRDYEIIQNMSLFEFAEYILHLKRAHYLDTVSHAKAQGDPSPEPPDPPAPEEPQAGGDKDTWFDYYYAMKKAGYKITIGDLARKTGWSENSLNSYHVRYKATHEKR